MIGSIKNNQLGIGNGTSTINRPEKLEMRNNTGHDEYIARSEQQIADLQGEV